MEAHLSIQAVSEQTGLSVHLIRAWERRYGALSPARSQTNRRLYTQSDVVRLKLLGQAVAAGNSIGLIAHLPDQELAELAPSLREGSTNIGMLERCIDALRTISGQALDAALWDSCTILGIDEWIRTVAQPLIAYVDREWEAGRLGIAQEHLASASLRNALDGIRRSIHTPSSAPKLIVTTPAGQVHELGALLAAIAASRFGWQVIYLGPDLPALEIATASRLAGAKAIALSLVFPADDPNLAQELRLLRQGVGDEVMIVAGGRAAAAYAEELQGIGATVLERIDQLGSLVTRAA